MRNTIYTAVFVLTACVPMDLVPPADAIAGADTVVTTADSTSPLPISDHGSGCLDGPMAQFGQYLGRWKIADSTLAQDGSGWSDGPGAQWDFVCVGEGTAIQDFWMPAGGPVGTNLRTYNTTTGAWDIAWAIKGTPGFAHITAKHQPDGSVVMRYVAPKPNPPRRITFFPAQPDSWDWKLQFSFDDEQTWTDVYRIRATRIE